MLDLQQSSVSTDNAECKCNCHAKPQLREPTNGEKWYFTLITTVIYLIVTNPLTYVFVNNTIGRLFGIKIADKSGCPSVNGLMLHAIVFTLILRITMG